MTISLIFPYRKSWNVENTVDIIIGSTHHLNTMATQQKNTMRSFFTTVWATTSQNCTHAMSDVSSCFKYFEIKKIN